LYGISESALDETLKELTEKSDPVIAPYAGEGEIALFVSAFSKTYKEAEEKCLAAEKKILELVGEFVYGKGETTLEKELVSLCKKKSLRLATAESCTGGQVSRSITSVPGASQVMTLGAVTYTEEMKKKILGVTEETLSSDGVYSHPCALEMARGARLLSGADLAVSVTGIAGPAGGTDSDPVGTVYLAVVSDKGEESLRVVLGTPSASRGVISTLATKKALAMALSHIKEHWGA
jgi:nicotinamide-nucleotide amidase